MGKRLNKINGNYRSIIQNFFYNFFGLILMNLVLQVVIYPSLNNRLGSDTLGVLLYLLSFINILTPSFGLAVRNFQLVTWRKKDYPNGDYVLTVLIFSALAILITTISTCSSLGSFSAFIFLALLLLFTNLRYYADVEFRMNLTFKKNFIFYIILSAGYLIGYGIFLLTDNWYIIFLLGELLAVGYVWFKGGIFKNFWQHSKDLPTVVKSSFILALSYLIHNFSLQLDRIILKLIVGNVAVSQYYVVSLIGKALSLFTAPVNALILSYLSRREEPINRKTFSLYTGIILAACAVFFGLCQVVVPIFIRLLYNDMYDEVKDLILVANLAQILSVASTTIFAVVLTFAHEKWQLIIQFLNVVLLVSIAILFTRMDGIVGFANAAMISNIIRVISIILVGMLIVGRHKDKSIPVEEEVKG